MGTVFWDFQTETDIKCIPSPLYNPMGYKGRDTFVQLNVNLNLPIKY